MSVVSLILSLSLCICACVRAQQLQDEAADVSVLRSSEEKYRNKIVAIQEEVDEHLEEINSLHTALQVNYVFLCSGSVCVCAYK